MRQHSSAERRLVFGDVSDRVSRFLSLSECPQEIGERIRIGATVTGGHHVLRIFPAVEQTDVRQRTGQRRAVPVEGKQVCGHVTASIPRYAAERTEGSSPPIMTGPRRRNE